MKVISCFLVLTGLLVLGCATNKLNVLQPDISARVRKVAIVDEISTPATLSTDTTSTGDGGALGLLISGAVESSRQNTFTSQVRAAIDFQAFAEETLRESFSRAVRSRQEWSLVESNRMDKADAAFLLEITDMGLDAPRGAFKLVYQPTITISATLIGNPPFDHVRGRTNVAAPIDPEKHPILYRKIVRISHKKGGKLDSYAANNFVTVGGFTGLPKYAGDAELFKAAYREAIDLAVKKFAESWSVQAAQK